MAGFPSFITGSGEVFHTGDAAQAERMHRLGLQEASAEDIHHDNLRQQFSDWEYTTTAAALGAANTLLPGATGLAYEGLNAISPQMGADFRDIAEGVSAAHPVAKGLGAVAGVGLTAAAGAGSGIVGAAEGLGVGGAAKAALAVGGGAATAAGMTFDQRALEHMQTPEGAEKVAAVYIGSAILGGLSGGLFSWAGGKLASGMLGKAGAGLETKGAAGVASKSPLNNPGVAGRLEDVGGSQSVAELAQKYDLLTASPKAIKNKVGEILKSSTAAMNEAKAVSTDVLELKEHTQFLQSLKSQLQGTGQERLVSRLEKESASVGDLHQVRIAIDRVVNREGAELSQVGAKLENARDMVGDHIEKVLEHNATLRPDVVGDQLSRWQTANADYHAASMLRDALKYREDTGKSFLGWAGQKMTSAGTTGALFSGISGNPGGIAAGLGMAGAGKALQSAEGAGAKALVGTGKLMQGVDSAFVAPAVKMLGGRSVAGPLGGMTAAKVLEMGDYTTVHAYVSWAAENPTLAVPKMAQALEDQGVPGVVVDSVIPQTIKGLQYLASMRPQSPWVGQTVAPMEWQPSSGQKAKFIDQANTVLNPFQALSELTPQRVETLRAVYPMAVSKLASLVAQEAATRPDLSRKARQQAALLTGIPSGPLSNPQSQAVLAMLDIQQSQPAQAQGGQQSGGSGNTIASTPTRLSRMSG